VLAGDDKNKFADEMKSLTKELEMQNDIVFLGFLSDDLPYVYNLAEAYLFPSHIECFSIALVEAMSAGLPVIASDINEIRESIGDAGILVDPKNVNSIAHAIEEVITSEELRLSMRKKSLERAKLFSWGNCAKETLEVYEDLHRNHH